MPKTSFLIIGIMLLGYAAKSQSHFGLKAGVNLANQLKTISIPQVLTTTQNTKPFVGYQLGVFHKTALNNQFAIAAEANFSVIGSRMTLFSSDGEGFKTNEKLGYIDIPLTLQYSNNKLYLGLGPSVGFRLFSKVKNFDNRTYNISNYRLIDAAGNFLAGYTVSPKVDVNARYSYGLLNIYKDPGYAKAMNRFFNLSMLYTLK